MYSVLDFHVTLYPVISDPVVLLIDEGQLFDQHDVPFLITIIL
jgi:hypothetical protein